MSEELEKLRKEIAKTQEAINSCIADIRRMNEIKRTRIEMKYLAACIRKEVA